MEVILLKDVAKVGKRHDIVTVADGYALHCLIPQGLAQAATPAARAMLETQKAKVSEQLEAHKAEVKKLIKGIDGKIVVMKEKANEKGHLFGALHTEQVVSALYDQLGVTLPFECVEMPRVIREVGEFPIQLVCDEVKATVTITVEGE